MSKRTGFSGLPDGRPENLKLTRPLARLEAGHTDWYRVQNKAGETPEIYIYDEIGYFGTASNAFVKDLAALSDSPELVVNLNSPGGDVFDGIGIYQALIDHPASVTIKINGLAASIASVIAMAGDRVVMGAKSQMMIHEGFTFASGDAATMRKTADLLDRISESIASVYADRAGGDAQMWRAAMREETWYNADEAVAAGLADEVEGRKEKPAKEPLAFDMSVYKYSGRDDAPEPVAKKEEVMDVTEHLAAPPVVDNTVKDEPVPFAWDFAAFKNALKEGKH